MLAVDVFLIAVGKVHDFGCVGIILPGIVDFQLHTKVPISVPVEDRVRLIVVILDYAMFSMPAMAAVASCRIIVFILIIGIVLMDCSAAVHTGRVVPVIASAAQRCFAVPLVII